VSGGGIQARRSGSRDLAPSQCSMPPSRGNTKWRGGVACRNVCSRGGHIALGDPQRFDPAFQIRAWRGGAWTCCGSISKHFCTRWKGCLVARSWGGLSAPQSPEGTVNSKPLTCIHLQNLTDTTPAPIPPRYSGLFRSEHQFVQQLCWEGREPAGSATADRNLSRRAELRNG